MAENHASPPPNTLLQWTGWHTFTLLVIIVMMVLAGVLIPTRARVWAWILTIPMSAIVAALCFYLLKLFVPGL